jgi:hypothetical protein
VNGRMCSLTVLLLVALGAVPAAALEVTLAAPLQDEPADMEVLLEELGAPPEAAMLLQLLDQGDGLDPMTMFMLMAMMEGGHGGPDMEGFLLLNMLGQGGRAPTAPTLTAVGDDLLIVEGGIAYKIDLATMELEAAVTYKEKKKADLANLLAMTLPMMADAQEQRQKAVAVEPQAIRVMEMAPGGPAVVVGQQLGGDPCQRNMEQLCAGAINYANDWDGVLPGDDWPETMKPYMPNGGMGILKCPQLAAVGEPGTRVGYALNIALAGLSMADIAEPARTVLLFECDEALEEAVGGQDAMVARHDGSVVIGFADGTARPVPIDQALQLLIWDPLG